MMMNESKIVVLKTKVKIGGVRVLPFGGGVEATAAELTDCSSKLVPAILFCTHFDLSVC